MTPCRASRNAIEKIPSESAPCTIGVSATLQLLPASEDRKTRATFPPVANHTFDFPSTATHVPLAANAPSPSIATGNDAETDSQFFPPFSVLITSNFPFAGSPTAIPCSLFQNAMQSKNPFGS